MQQIFEKINESILEIKKYCDFIPEVAIILGTGLGKLISDIDVVASIDYSQIPHFKKSTLESHSGKLIFGRLSGKNIVVMQGRFHYYEGYTMQEITYPVRVMRALGATTLIVSNACGTMNPLFKKGEIMLIDDFINLLGTNPLIGQHDERLGERILDMSEPFSQRLIKLSENIALEQQIKVFKGTYAAMTGPSLETRAEYRFLRTIGADAVGMSTVPEVIVAKQVGFETVGFSVLTDECFPDALKPLTLKEIIETADIGEPKLTKIVKELLKRI